MQRVHSERAAWLRTTYERALAEVAREHARAGAVPRAARQAVAATATTAATTTVPATATVGTMVAERPA